MIDFVESKPLFDIPIYRCSEGKYGKEFSETERRYMQQFDRETAPISYAKIKSQFMETYWYPWKFNEIVGYIHLHVEHSPKIRVKIDGDLFYVKAKRIVKGGKGKIFGMVKSTNILFIQNTHRNKFMKTSQLALKD